MSSLKTSLVLAAASMTVPYMAHAAVEFGRVHPTSVPGQPYAAHAEVIRAPSGITIGNASASSYMNMGLPSRWSQTFTVRYSQKTHRLHITSGKPLEHSAVVILQFHGQGESTRVECPVKGQPYLHALPLLRGSNSLMNKAAFADAGKMASSAITVTTPVASDFSHSVSSVASDKTLMGAKSRTQSARQASERLRRIISTHDEQPEVTTPLPQDQIQISRIADKTTSIHSKNDWRNSPYFHIGKGHIVAIQVASGPHPLWRCVHHKNRHLGPANSAQTFQATLKMRVLPLRPINPFAGAAIIHFHHTAVLTSVHIPLMVTHHQSTPFLHGYGVPYLANGWAFAGHVGPVRKGQTLWQIASNVNASGRFTLSQVMVAIVKANPSSFIHGNPSLLRAGSMLVMPGFDKVQTITPAHALLWMRLASFAHNG